MQQCHHVKGGPRCVLREVQDYLAEVQDYLVKRRYRTILSY